MSRARGTTVAAACAFTFIAAGSVLGLGSIPPPGAASCGADPSPDELADCGYEASSC